MWVCVCRSVRSPERIYSELSRDFAGSAPASYAVDIIIRHLRPTKNDAWRPPKKKERRKTRRKRRTTSQWKKKYWHDAGRGINDPFLHRYFRCLLRIIACYGGEYATNSQLYTLSNRLVNRIPRHPRWSPRISPRSCFPSSPSPSSFAGISHWNFCRTSCPT